MILTIQEIVDLCSFAGIEVDKEKSTFAEDPEQLETEIQIGERPDKVKVAWLYEYPEEGSYQLGPTSPEMK